MNTSSAGVSQPHKRKRRQTLGVGSALFNPLLTGLEIDGLELAHLRAWCKIWVGHANKFQMNKRHRGGMFSCKPLTKSDADTALKRELAALEGGDA